MAKSPALDPKTKIRLSCEYKFKLKVIWAIFGETLILTLAKLDPYEYGSRT